MEKTAFDYARYVFATILTIISIGLIGYAIAEGHAALPGHPIMQYILLIFDLTLLAYLEGLQVAILALERVRYSTFPEHMKRAIASHKLATAGKGINVQRFLVGRQFFVVFVVFLCAQLTTYAGLKDDMSWMPETMFLVLIETGLPGALIVLAFGQLMPQLVAATHPITFMNLPGTWSVIQLCLCFEAVGVTHFSWVLSWTVKKVFNMGVKEKVKRSAKSGNVMKGVEMRTSAKAGGHGHGKGKNTQGDVEVGGLAMNVHILDADALYSATEDGLSLASDSDVYSSATMQWLQHDAIKSIAAAYFAVSDEGNKLPDPQTIVRWLVQNGQPVPRYLLPPWHKQHIPPHICAYELCRREQNRKNRECAKPHKS